MAITMKLTLVTGSEVGRTIDIPPQGVTLGRSRLAELHFEDGLLSRLHCRFFYAPEPSVQDLGSSNGTLLNGVALEGEARALREGDVLAVGALVFRVSVEGALDAPPSVQPNVSSPKKTVIIASTQPPPSEPPASVVPSSPLIEPPPPVEGMIDLGLGPKVETAEPKRTSMKGLIFVLGAVAVLALGSGILFSVMQAPASKPPRERPLADPTQAPFELQYERLAITDNQLFRYTLIYRDNGVLRLSIDDLGNADRSFSKEKKLSQKASDALRSELLEANYAQIGEMFPERSSDGVTLRRKRLTIVFGSEVWSRTSENVTNKPFNVLCERLENFGRNELGVYATQYSVSELRAMGEEQLHLAQRYWEQRDLGDEKLWLCFSAYCRGLSALETLNPKPAFAEDLTDGKTQAEALLRERYEAEAFAVDQAMNVQRYEQAAEHLRRILRMIPDREDERNISTTEKLLSVENRFLKRRK